MNIETGPILTHVSISRIRFISNLSVNLFPEQSLEEWFRKNRRCSIAISGNGEKVKEITARGLPVNANNVAPPPLNGARKSIEELVNQVGVRFEEMLARA